MLPAELSFSSALLNRNVTIATAAYSNIAAAALANASSYVAIDESSFDSVTQKSKELFWILAISVSVITAISLLFVCCMCTRIAFAIKVMRLAAAALGDMPLLIFTPIVPVIFNAALMIYCVGIGLFLASSGEFNPTTYSYAMSDVERYLLLYHIFAMIWTYCFITACFQFSIVGSTCFWYYDRSKPGCCRFPYITAVGLLLRYYLGSVAFGAFILAAIKFIKLIFNYMASKMKEAKDSRTIQCVVACVNCCLSCIERFIEFLNKNAYVMQVLTGESFCTSAVNAFALLAKNGLRLVATQWISTCFLALGRLLITAATVIFAIFYMVDFRVEKFRTVTQEDSGVDPISVALIAVISFFIASCLMAIYTSIIDAIFVCYCHAPAVGTDEMKNALDDEGKVGGCCCCCGCSSCLCGPSGSKKEGTEMTAAGTSGAPKQTV